MMVLDNKESKNLTNFNHCIFILIIISNIDKKILNQKKLKLNKKKKKKLMMMMRQEFQLKI